VQPRHRAREDGAGFLGAVADGDDEIDRFIAHGLEGLGTRSSAAIPARRKAANTSAGTDLRRLCARRDRPQRRREFVFEESLRQLRTTGVVRTQHEHGLCHRHAPWGAGAVVGGSFSSGSVATPDRQVAPPQQFRIRKASSPSIVS